MRAIRPSWFVLFWAVAYLTIFFDFQHQPVERLLGNTASIAILGVYLAVFLIVRLLERRGHDGVDYDNQYKRRNLPPLQIPQWLRVVSIFSVIVSVALLTLVCVIVVFSGASTIFGWQAAMESAFPEFGRVFLHLKQIAIPYLILKAEKVSPRLLIILAFYFVASAVYSFTMGERVFFLETALLILIPATLRGWIRVTPVKIAIAAAAFVAFFMLVENAKRFILTDTQEGDLVENFSLISDSLSERLLAYYADPTAKMQFVLAEGRFVTDSVWFKNSIGMYASRLGLDIQYPAGINLPYWSSGHGGPVLTNPGGFTALFVDFGPLFFVPIAAFLSLFVWVYRRTMHGSPPAAFAYVLCAIAALELPRVAYFYWARFWLPLLALLLALGLFKIMQQTMRVPGSVCVDLPDT